MTALRDFLKAADGFIAAPQNQSAMAALVTARMRLTDGGIPKDANWTGLLRAVVALATAAQDAPAREDRRDALAEIMRLALAEWRGDLGDDVMTAPRAAPAPIRQYKDE